MTIEKETLSDVVAGVCCIIPPYVLDHLVTIQRRLSCCSAPRVARPGSFEERSLPVFFFESHAGGFRGIFDIFHRPWIAAGDNNTSCWIHSVTQSFASQMLR
jgi:hypothetical protein